ncbi:MAG TPA: choline kinase family protein [Actinomycetota bacterium]|nr:choline kinase family protein [Actinomycetota bacterium]
MDVDPRLEKVLGWLWPGREPTLTPIASGITNANVKVEVDGEAFVVRLPGTDTELLGIDRHAELEATRIAAAAGVGPEVVDFVEGCLVTRFLPGDPIPVEDLEREDVLAPVVRAIRSIHAAAPVPSTFPVFRIVERYRDLAAGRGVAIPAAYERARALAGRIQGAFAANPVAEVTCHNDLLNANFLKDGDRVRIVDYEYAGVGDPFFDLGNFSINNELSPAAQEALLRLTFPDLRDVHRARLGLMRVMSDFREAMWGVLQQGISTLDVDYVAYADRHFARLEATAADDRFEDWLAAARDRP